MLPVVAAALPIGLLFGTLAAARGLSPLEAGLMSAATFAGAAQFVAIDLWRDPAPIALVTLSAFVVNMRHILMGASLSRHMGAFRAPRRAIAAFYLTDETWALCERRALAGPLTPAFYWGMSAALWLQWIIGTTIGAAAGKALGDPRDYGFDFAFTAIFICIALGFWRGARTGAVLAASGGAAAAAKLLIPGAWYIAIGALAGVAAAAVLGEEADARPVEEPMP